MAGRDRLHREAGGGDRLTREQIQRLQDGVEALERLRDEHGGGPAIDRIDARALTVTAPAMSFNGARIEELVNLGIRFELRAVDPGWSIEVSAGPDAPLGVRADGRVQRLVADRDEDAFAAAIADDEVDPVLAALGSHPATVELELVNPSSAGFRWIATQDALASGLSGGSWLATVERMFERDGPVVLVVGDGGDAWIAAPGLVVRGPDADSAPVPDERVSEEDRGWLLEVRPGAPPLPSPAGVAPTAHEGFDEVHALLIGTAKNLCWWWLAEEADADAAPPRVRFVGQRVAQISLMGAPAESAADEIALWNWGTESTDPGRRGVVQQAVALAIFGPDDVPEAARPALRTAQTLLKNVRSRELAEALATRRSVREAAIAAGRTAAEGGRTAAAKALERVLVQAAAAAGILIARAADKLSAAASLRLLGLVAALLAMSALLAFVVDFPAARSAITRFRQDLALYGDTLAEGDLDKLRDMHALTDADSRVTAAMVVAGAIFGSAALALAVAFVRIA